MQIPLVDLRAQYAGIKGEILAAIEDVLDGMQLHPGPQTQLFEKDFAAYCHASHAIALSSGTEALIQALRACQIGPGDEVITVANSFIATVEAIALVGARPVFVDIEPESYLLDCQQLVTALTERTRAIIPVHLYGHPVDMQPLLAFARHHHLTVIEDCSQAHGALYAGQPVGTLGDIGCFSLYCSKNLGAYGEAGICVTNQPELAERLSMGRNHGANERYLHNFLGTNARMDELQAAILRVKLRHLEHWNQARRVRAHIYNQELQGIVAHIPQVQSWAIPAYHLYIVEVAERNAFRQALDAAGIASSVHYPIPLHLQPACASYGYRPGSLPVTEQVAQRIVSLPMYPELTSEQQSYIITTIQQILTCAEHSLASISTQN